MSYYYSEMYWTKKVRFHKNAASCNIHSKLRKIRDYIINVICITYGCTAAYPLVYFLAMNLLTCCSGVWRSRWTGLESIGFMLVILWHASVLFRSDQSMFHSLLHKRILTHIHNECLLQWDTRQGNIMWKSQRAKERRARQTDERRQARNETATKGKRRCLCVWQKYPMQLGHSV